MRRWLVLVVPEARLHASWFAYRAVCYELRSVSPCDNYGGAPNPSMMQGAALATYNVITDTVRTCSFSVMDDER